MGEGAKDGMGHDAEVDVTKELLGLFIFVTVAIRQLMKRTKAFECIVTIVRRLVK